MIIILEILGVLLLIGGLVITAAFYAALITGLIVMFLTGIEIVTAPVQSCTSGCFTTLFDSKPLGWILIATPILMLLSYLTMRFGYLINRK
ncbi:hypothetical protein O3J91_06680 [Yersinia pestis]|nr:hypothetical protein [Yersinia pestis]MDL1129173.1 hypothetical protein [Yersinia pestis]